MHYLVSSHLYTDIYCMSIFPLVFITKRQSILKWILNFITAVFFFIKRRRRTLIHFISLTSSKKNLHSNKKNHFSVSISLVFFPACISHCMHMGKDLLHRTNTTNINIVIIIIPSQRINFFSPLMHIKYINKGTED